MTKDELIAFEQEIADTFNAGRIPYPIHLSGGNEDALTDIFKDVKAEDWVLGTWRAHYHCLLKGVPPAELKQAIMEGDSIALSFPEYRIFCSAIAGGAIPIAVGISMGIKRRGGSERVWCFLGDMVSRSGIFHESYSYASGHDLPVHWVIEDNGLSVCTKTRETWGLFWHPRYHDYEYDLTWPHAGTGKRINF